MVNGSSRWHDCGLCKPNVGATFNTGNRERKKLEPDRFRGGTFELFLGLHTNTGNNLKINKPHRGLSLI